MPGPHVGFLADLVHYEPCIGRVLNSGDERQQPPSFVAYMQATPEALRPDSAGFRGTRTVGPRKFNFLPQLCLLVGHVPTQRNHTT